jgi:hypothetical protein
MMWRPEGLVTRILVERCYRLFGRHA